MSIVLIGYRGSGKTTIGRLLSQKLACSFDDSDQQIVATANKTIKEIFVFIHCMQSETEFRSSPITPH